MKIKLIDKVISRLAEREASYSHEIKGEEAITLGRGREVCFAFPSIIYLDNLTTDSEEYKILLPMSKTVSRKHCTIIYDGSNFKIVDGVDGKKSRDGVSVNGKPVLDKEGAQLNSGDKITLGKKYSLTFIVMGDEPEKMKVVD